MFDINDFHEALASSAVVKNAQLVLLRLLDDSGIRPRRVASMTSVDSGILGWTDAKEFNDVH